MTGLDSTFLHDQAKLDPDLLILSLSKDEDTLLSAQRLSKRMKIYVYMLRCRDGSYYLGLTREGLDKRIGEHQSGRFTGYTYSRRPVKLVWSADFQWLKDAIACERRLKGWRREKKEALIRGNYTLLSSLARTAKPPRPSTSSG